MSRNITADVEGEKEKLRSFSFRSQCIKPLINNTLILNDFCVKPGHTINKIIYGERK